MTAREMFEKLGYQVVDECCGSIVYELEDGVDEPVTIEFDGTLSTYTTYRKEAVYLTKEELKAIIQQAKELGWLDD